MITPPAWPVVDWTELLPQKAAPDTEETDRDLFLWHLLRRVHVWALCNDLDRDPRHGAPEPRGYRRAVAPPLDVNEQLATLGGALGNGADRVELLAAALRVSAWAEVAGKPLLALRFAEAAAACDPFDPAPANAAGRLSRTLGMGPRADLWYSRGIGLARARRWSACYVRAHIGYGTLFKELGRTERALELFSRAAWRAQKSGIKWLAGEVIHDSLLLAISRRAFPEAEAFAARALAIYPRHHDRIPALVHDFSLLCTREGVFSLAFPLLRRVVSLVHIPHERLIVWSTVAFSAAGAERADAYAEARDVVLEQVDQYPTIAPPALMNLAFAAHLRREWRDAEAQAQRALELAGGNPLFQEQARDARLLLSQVAMRAPATPSIELPAPAGHKEEALRPLYEACLQLVTRWRGRTWRRVRQQTAAGAFGRA